MNKKEEIIESLQPLFKEARQKNLWFYSNQGFQQLWFTPDELEKLQKKDKFIWGPVNWDLKDPQIWLDQLSNDLAEKKKEIKAFKARMEANQ